MEEALDIGIVGDLGDEYMEFVILENVLVDRDEVNPNPHFNLEEMSDEDIKLHFRFNREDLVRVANLLGLNNDIIADTRNRVNGVTALCMLLRRLAYPNRLRDISPMFNISPQSLSQIIRKTVDTIIENQVIKISDLNVLQWLNRDRLELYSQAVSRRGGAIQNCWGFIDGTVRQICRPSVEQEDYYSGHKRCHCVKYQSVIAPDGIIVSLKGAYMGKRHDAGIFRESQLYLELEQKTVFDDKLYVLYGDQAYGIRQLLLAPYAGQNILPHQEHFNATMRTLRVSVEWGFQKIISLFAFLEFKKNQKLLLQDVESLYKVGVILSNCHTCLYGSQTASYFNIEPPLIENYLAV